MWEKNRELMMTISTVKYDGTKITIVREKKTEKCLWETTKHVREKGEELQ